MKKTMLMLFISIITIVLAACSGGDNNNKKTETKKPTVEITDEEKVADDEIVAIIDGQEITGEFYNEVYLQEKAINQDILGDNFDLEDIKTGTIEAIINDVIILHMGEAEDIVITDEEVEEEIKELKKYGEEGYDTLLEQFNYTEESIGHLLRVETTLKRYIDKHIEVEVSDEEVEKYYEEVAAGGEEIPPIENAWQELEDVIRVDKSKEEARKHIAAFRKNIEIDIKL